ncbi:MurR/RpiR family transcriptional regulator [Streptomyces sp. AM 2-1-1]|uniref:MurR/RpiR family transcriptional regulator n=1 Tax=Streptomyces sp. AM 2-1-1 TaxID=3028709 RepID=UPI0023B89439|nr:MurR/RpiR family transcriptional regulator [Streptomyces sp. AM 2-1-1]WEH41432.1 MurR/RpiR family transcriptional regulator [Streptomyces sp. AM 2-1-1]
MDPVVAQLEEIYPRLAPGERAVARLLLDDYPFAALGSLRTLAERAGVSPPTASRLVDRLGHEGFAGFQAAVRTGAQERSRLREFAAQGLDPRGAAAELHHGLSETIAAFHAPLLESAAGALVGARAVWALGGPLSELAADYLVRQLGALRPAVRFVTGSGPERARSLLEVASGDLVVAYDFRRYSAQTAAFARAAVARGARLLLITDAWRSPLADHAHVLAPLPRAAAGPIAPLTHEIAVTELLLVATAAKLNATERLDELDELTRSLQPPAE